MDLRQIEDVGSLGTGADYLYFLCGLMFIPLVFSTRCMGRSRNPALPWFLLSWFAMASAAVHWLFLLLLSQDPAAIQVRYLHGMEILPWVLLLEFGRRAANPGRQNEGLKITWLLLLLAVCVTAVMTVGTGHVFLLGCGLLSSLFGGVTFWNAGRNAPTNASRMHFRTAGMAAGLLGMTGLVAIWFPLTALILNIILAGVLSLSLFLEHQAWRCQRLAGLEYSISLREHRSAAILMGVILVAGFVATNFMGMKQDQDLRDAIMHRAALAASAVNADGVRRLEWNTNDEASRDYVELKRLMMAMVKANPDLRFASLVGLKNGNCFILVDSEPPDSKDYSPPGIRTRRQIRFTSV